jgi:hypothetical protein
MALAMRLVLELNPTPGSIAPCLCHLYSCWTTQEFPMQANSDLAVNTFGADMAWAEAHGPAQVEHCIRKMTEEFMQDAFLVAAISTFPAVKSTYQECEAKGLVDRHEDPAVTTTVVTLPGAIGLSVRRADGDHVLYAWNIEGEKTVLSIIPWRDPMPAELMAELNGLVEAGATFEQLGESASKFAGYSGLPVSADRKIYSKVPLSIADIREALTTTTLEALGRIAGVGSFTNYRPEPDEDDLGSGLSAEARRKIAGMISEYVVSTGRAISLKTVQDIYSAFPSEDKLDTRKGARQFAALKQGNLQDLHASVCAMSLEHHLHAALDGFASIFKACDELGLSSEFRFAFNDTDVRVYTERHEIAGVFVHTNIDLCEGCAFAIVFPATNQVHRSVDVFLVERWDTCFESYFGKLITDVASSEDAIDYLRHVHNEKAWIGEDELIDQLRAGNVPTKGKAFSYEIDSGLVEVTDLAVTTGFLDYFPSMVKYDHKFLSNAVNGDFDEYGQEFLLRDRSEGPMADEKQIGPEEYLAGRVVDAITPK